MKHPRLSTRSRIGLAALLLALAGCTGGCAGAGQGVTADGTIVAVGAENQYANVIAQVGGALRESDSASRATRTPILTPSRPAPASPRPWPAAGLIVQNGLGYDTFMERIESASPSARRKVIDVQKLLGLPDSTPNPHLWYKPQTMPAVASAVAAELSALQPAHSAYFQANAAAFEQSLAPWYRALKQFAAEYPDTPVATTEPVGDYMLEAAGTVNLTPFGLQADIMNGVDPAPQDVTLQNGLFATHRVKVFVYNQQVTDSLTKSFLQAAKREGVPVVGVYETMPTPGYDYQSWMLAEVRALHRAVADKLSTRKL